MRARAGYQVSILQCNKAQDDLEIRSLHYFEKEEFRAAKIGGDTHALLRADSAGRCVAMLAYDSRVAVIPLHDEALGDEDARPSHMIDLHALGIWHVKDMQFIENQFEASLAILYETNLTWIGRAFGSNPFTSCLSVISVEAQPRVLWSIRDLPCSAYSLRALSSGVIVLSPNMLFHLNQTQAYAAQLNHFAQHPLPPYPLHPAQCDVITLDAAQCTVMPSGHLLFSLKGGELYLAHMAMESSRVRQITLTRLAASALTSSMALHEDFLFLASRLGDSLLLRVEALHGDESNKRRKTDLADGSADGEDAASAQPEAELSKPLMEVDLEDLEMFGAPVKSQGPGPVTSYAFTLSDSLPNLGPMHDMAIGVTSHGLSIVACSGYAKHGALCVTRPRVPTDSISFQLADAEALFTLRAEKHLKDDETKDHHAYLLISRPASTLVLSVGEELVELSNCELRTDVPTLFAANMTDHVLQVHSEGLRLVRGVAKSANNSVIDHRMSVKAAALAGSYLIVLQAENIAKVFELNGEHIRELVVWNGVTAVSAFVRNGRALAAIARANTVTLCSLPGEVLASYSKASGRSSLTPDVHDEQNQQTAHSDDSGTIIDYIGLFNVNSGVLAIGCDGWIDVMSLQEEWRWRCVGRVRGTHATAFENIGGAPGLFVAPEHWVMLQRGMLRIHAAEYARAIAPFHNVHYTHGFIAATEDDLKLGGLAGGWSFDFTWPYRKVPLRNTPNKIAYHAESRTFTIALAKRHVVQQVDEAGDAETQQYVRNDVPQYMDKYELRLLDSKLETVHQFLLEENESVLALRVIPLRTSGRNTYKPFMIIGTGIADSEQTQAKGRILIFDIIILNDQRARFKLVYNKEQKGGPVSAIAALHGELLVAVGQKMYLYNFEDGTSLVGKAFFDMQIYTVTLNVVKDWILVGDMFKNVCFFRWKADIKHFVLIGRDTTAMFTCNSEYLIDNERLGFVVSDHSKNLHLLQYAPQRSESSGGELLLCRGTFHLGTQASRLMRVALSETQHGLLYCCPDGSLGMLVPLQEGVFKRLGALHNRMVSTLGHFAGLNPKSFRGVRTSRWIREGHNIIDGDVVKQFSELDVAQQSELARKIGTTVAQLNGNLSEIMRSTFIEEYVTQ